MIAHHHPHTIRAAKFLRSVLQNTGFEVKMVQGTEGTLFFVLGFGGGGASVIWSHALTYVYLQARIQLCLAGWERMNENLPSPFMGTMTLFLLYTQKVKRVVGTGTISLLLLVHFQEIFICLISPPFSLTGRDGFLYGRGVTDDKGICLYLFIYHLTNMVMCRSDNRVFIRHQGTTRSRRRRRHQP